MKPVLLFHQFLYLFVFFFFGFHYKMNVFGLKPNKKKYFNRWQWLFNTFILYYWWLWFVCLFVTDIFASSFIFDLVLFFSLRKKFSVERIRLHWMCVNVRQMFISCFPLLGTVNWLWPIYRFIHLFTMISILVLVQFRFI